MTGSAAAAAASQDIKSILEAKAVKFNITTGGAKYQCQIHSDRASYERIKSRLSSSSGSINSASTTQSK